MDRHALLNLPNLLTFSRIASAFLLVYLWFFATWFAYEYIRVFALLVIYIVAVVTDYYDGYFARKLKAPTSFGKFFDPLADKILILTIFFAYFYIPALGIWVWPVLLITAREVAITLLRIYCSMKNIPMATEMHGKLKTVVQITAQIFVWLILFLYAIVYESEMFRHFIARQGGDITQQKLHEIPFVYYEAFFKVELQASWAGFILKWMPNGWVMACMAITLYSGVAYLIRNAHVFSKPQK